MRVLAADRLSESSLDEMRTLGVEVIYDPDLDGEELVNVLDGVNVLIVRGTVVNKAAIDAGKALNLIIRAGAGVSNIDVSTASERGIYVANCPGKNASAVAELTLTLIGCLDRRVPDGVASLRAGKW
ncbi:MAG TPA: D-3-phosphoglycerate dehydrogenase, partial [Polyangiaceae bacterium]